MRPWLGHGVIGIGCGEQPRLAAERACADAAVVAASIDALVVIAAHSRRDTECRHARNDPLGVVRMQPDGLPFRPRQRPGPLPCPGRDRGTPEVVEVTGQTYRGAGV